MIVEKKMMKSLDNFSGNGADVHPLAVAKTQRLNLLFLSILPLLPHLTTFQLMMLFRLLTVARTQSLNPLILYPPLDKFSGDGFEPLTVAPHLPLACSALPEPEPDELCSEVKIMLFISTEF